MIQTRSAGFSGIADTTWDVAFPKKMRDKSNVGKQSVATSHKSKRIADKETSFVAHANGRQCCIGRMIVGNSNCFYS